MEPQHGHNVNAMAQSLPYLPNTPLIVPNLGLIGPKLTILQNTPYIHVRSHKVMLCKKKHDISYIKKEDHFTNSAFDKE